MIITNQDNGKNNLLTALKFVQFINDFQQVRRMLLANGEDRMENNVEHSYKLAMLAWYFISTDNLKLDLGLAIKYSLVHDLVEVYAGDTYTYSTDDEFKNSKKEREAKALKQLEAEFTEFPELIKLIEKYEDKTDPESLFIYALDKIEPIINIYLDGGKTWRNNKITLEMITENKMSKVENCPEVKKYLEQLLELIKQNQEELF